MAEDVTPIRQQYLEIKRQYPNAILLFRLGDFYETFDQDAETTARELDIVLTSRPIGKGLRAPLAGIPYHAIENYLARLIEKGYHVAICEQVGDQPIKGIFPRKVVRVVTPGTIVEPGMLSGSANNYLASVILEEEHAGIAYVDITTGEFAVTQLNTEDFTPIRAELTRLHPAEIIFPDNIKFPDGITDHATPWTAWRFEAGKCQEVLLAHFGISTLDGFGLKDLPLAARAAGSILQYLMNTESAALSLLTNLHIYSLNDYMALDYATRRNLELTETLRGEINGSLLGTIDRCVTPMGKRLIRQWVSQPLLDINRITHRLDGVETFYARAMLRAETRDALKPIADIERLTNRIITSHAQPWDLVALRDSLTRIPNILKLFDTEKGPETFPINNLRSCSAELDLLQKSIQDDPPSTLQNTGVIRPGYSSELDSVIEASQHAREWINNLEFVERERTGIKSLKVGYNKVFGYYIEITHANTKQVPSDYIRKQTLVNAERYITPEMKEYETLVLNAEERIREIELRLFREVCASLANSASLLLETARAIAEMDVFASLAESAALGNYIRPEVQEEILLEIREGRHPVVEQSMHGERYVPNDVIFEPGEIVRVITGPNMSGKSTYLRQAALIVLMAQMGSFVPAKSANRPDRPDLYPDWCPG